MNDHPGSADSKPDIRPAPAPAPAHQARPGYSGDGNPRFGRLLLVLALAVLLVIAITAGSQAYFTP